MDAIAVRTAQRRLLRALTEASGGAVGPWLAELVAGRMAERLEIIRIAPVRVLDASGPLGASLGRLRQAYPLAELHALQAAAAPLAEDRPWWARWRDLARRLPRPPGIQALPPARSVPVGAPLPDGLQLVWSNLALGFHSDPPAELARWHAAIQPGGFVMFSALGPDTLRELRALHARAGWGPAAQAFTDMHDYGDMLVRAGFADPVMDQETIRLTWGDAQTVLRDLRAVGANTHPGRFAGCRTPRWRAALCTALESLRGPDGRIGLSFEVAYGHAFRVDRPPRGAAHATFSVDELRQTARTFQSSIAQAPGKAPDLG